MSERDKDFERAVLRADIRAGNAEAAAMQYDLVTEGVAANTDRELWRKGDGDGNGMSYYEPSIHVTAQGAIGINVGGMVYTMPVEDWHALAASVGPPFGETLRAVMAAAGHPDAAQGCRNVIAIARDALAPALKWSCDPDCLHHTGYEHHVGCGFIPAPAPVPIAALDGHIIRAAERMRDDAA